MRAHLSKLEAKLEALLQHVSEELATEVGREQNHLMLMQDQARADLVNATLAPCLAVCTALSKGELQSMRLQEQPADVSGPIAVLAPPAHPSQTCCGTALCQLQSTAHNDARGNAVRYGSP